MFPSLIHRLAARPARHQFSLLVIGLLLFGATAAPLPAQSAAGRIGVVDMEAVTQRSQKIQSSVKRAQQQVMPQQDEIDAKRREWARLRQDLSARRSVMKDSEIQTQETKVRELREEVDKLSLAVDQRINRLQDEVLRPEIQRIMKIVEQIAKSEGFTVVLPVEQVLYYDEAVDLTSRVIQAIDRGEGGATETKSTPALPASEEKPAAKSTKKDSVADSAESAPAKSKGSAAGRAE